MRESVPARLGAVHRQELPQARAATDVPASCAAALGQYQHPDAERTIRRPLLEIEPG